MIWAWGGASTARWATLLARDHGTRADTTVVAMMVRDMKRPQTK